MHERDKIERRNEGRWIVYKDFVDRVFKTGVLLLLTGILGVLVAICAKIPEAPLTVGEYRSEQDYKARSELWKKMPMVQVRGSVSID